VLARVLVASSPSFQRNIFRVKKNHHNHICGSHGRQHSVSVSVFGFAVLAPVLVASSSTAISLPEMARRGKMVILSEGSPPVPMNHEKIFKGQSR